MSNYNPITSWPIPIKIVFIGLLVLVGLFITAIASLVLSKFFLGNLSSLTTELFAPVDEKKVFVLKLLQLLNHLFMFIVPALIWTYLTRTYILQFPRTNSHILRVNIIFAILIIPICMPFIHLLLDINAHMHMPAFLSEVEIWMKKSEQKAAHITGIFLSVNTYKGWLFNIFIIAIIPSLSEELFFRGVLQNIFHEVFKKALWAILLSALIFSAIHMQFYGFIPRFFLGALFGYVYWLTKNLWYPILMHFVNNALTVTAYFLSSKKLINQSVIENPEGLNPLLYFSSILLIISSVILIRKYNKKRLPINE